MTSNKGIANPASQATTHDQNGLLYAASAHGIITKPTDKMSGSNEHGHEHEHQFAVEDAPIRTSAAALSIAKVCHIIVAHIRFVLDQFERDCCHDGPPHITCNQCLNTGNALRTKK